MAVRTSGHSLLETARLRRGQARAEQALDAALAGGREHATRARERLGETGLTRPEGPLIWLHVKTEADLFDLLGLVSRIEADHADVQFLVTTEVYDPDESLPGMLPENCLHQYLPYEEGLGFGNFMAHWRPDLAIWAAHAPPMTLLRAADIDLPRMIWINAALSDDEMGRLRWFPRMSASALKEIDTILAVDGRTAMHLRRLGVEAGRIEVAGQLREGRPPLPCNQSERDSLAELLASRPVWLAVGVTEAEEEAVIAAHARVAKRSHRLLLILVPDDEDRGERLAEKLERKGWITALRSTEEEPDPQIEIYIADIPGELGLWYRLAPVAFLGFGRREGGETPDPYAAAMLGASVIHGPAPNKWAPAFDRLDAAGAANLVQDEEELAHALDYLLSPDKAAEVARAAWEVVTEGAEVTDKVCGLVSKALDETEGAA